MECLAMLAGESLYVSAHSVHSVSPRCVPISLDLPPFDVLTLPFSIFIAKDTAR